MKPRIKGAKASLVVVDEPDSYAVPRDEQELLDAGWRNLWGDVQHDWTKRAGLPVRLVGPNAEAYTPGWAYELYVHLLPDEPPAADEHLAPMFALGRALRAGALTGDAVEGAFRLGGPEAVVALSKNLGGTT